VERAAVNRTTREQGGRRAEHPQGGEDLYDTRPTFEARLAGETKRAVKRRAQALLRLAIGAVGWLTRDRRYAVAPQAGDPAIRRILVVRVDLLGAVRALRRAYPRAQIDMLVLHSTAGILAGESADIERVLTFDPHAWRRPTALLRPGTWRDALHLLRTLHAARYDLAISISGDIGSILTRLSGARRRVGYAAEAYPFLLTDTLPGGRYRVHQHEVRYVLALAERAGGLVRPGDDALSLRVLPQAAKRMDETLRAARRSSGARGPVVALHAGARNGQAKRWPPAHLAALTDRLIADLDALVVLTGAPSEAPLAREVLAHCTRRPINLVSKTSLQELAALLAASDQLVTGDSGPLHIACAVGTPVVALHGATAADAIVLRRRLWCSPCYDASATAECRFGNPVCMKRLTPNLVYTAARRQLRRQTPSAVDRREGVPHVSLASPT